MDFYGSLGRSTFFKLFRIQNLGLTFLGLSNTENLKKIKIEKEIIEIDKFNWKLWNIDLH